MKYVYRVRDNYGNLWSKVLGRKPVKGNIPTNRRKVGRYTENGVLTKTYDYIRQTEQDGFRATTVSHCLAGKVKLHK